MRILYGLCGIGFGHATRSAVSIRHLRALGHEVLVAADRDKVPAGVPSAITCGARMMTKNGAVDASEMIAENVRRLPELLTVNGRAWRSIERFAPDAVVTDHDAMAYLYGKVRGLPVISIDNSQIVVRCEHPEAVVGAHRDAFDVLAARTRWKVGSADRFLITSFYHPPVRQEERARTVLIPPVLRSEVLEATPTDEGYVLVYASKASSSDDAAMREALAGVDARAIVYGVDGDLPPNCERRTFGDGSFVHDLAACTAVLGNGGMSLIGEALAMGKPVYAVPLRDQYEQVMNAAYLEALGYGVMNERFEEGSLRRFLANLDGHRAVIARYAQHDRNETLYAELERVFGTGR